MASLTEHVMINKWDDDINNAIVSVGGNTEGSSGLPDYPDIIKSQLTSNKAVGEGIYQDFLYVNDNNDTSIYPWDGDPTESTNAPQSTVLAKSIKELYDIMKSTERFKVLLVDELPKSEIDLSAVYLIKESCECGCELEHTYSGCYYIKVGKRLEKVDIPEFKIDLNSLFYITRAEYDSNLPNYIKNIEQQLKKKFGKYWEDDNFSLETLIDEIKNELKGVTEGYLEELNKKIDNKFIEVDDKLLEVENKLKADIVDIEASLANYVPRNSLKEINDEINNLQ